MKRITWHWTGGGYDVTPNVLSSYHFVIDGEGKVHEGYRPPEVNRAPLDPDYVRHCGGMNTDNIGIAICAMGGREVQEAPLVIGNYPPKYEQLAALVDLTADLCHTYRIPVTRQTTFTHSEVRPRFGRGKYKWDINLLPGRKALVDPEEAGDIIRRRVRQELADRKPRRPRAQPWLTRILAQLAVSFLKSRI